jgi:hypothetical protein
MSEPRRHERMPQRCDDVALEDQVRAVRTEYADEEAEAAEMEALHAGSEPTLTVTQVEEIARRIMRETA